MTLNMPANVDLLLLIFIFYLLVFNINLNMPGNIDFFKANIVIIQKLGNKLLKTAESVLP